MKITAGLGSLDDYIPFVEAGADECFCGYVPEDWAVRYGAAMPLNRREVLYYNVQIGSRSELRILSKMVEVYGVPVSIALNGLYYAPEHYPAIAELMLRCADDGFSSFIIADPALLLYLHEKGLSERFDLHISGELGEVNHILLERLCLSGADRLIFHRKTTLADMASMIAHSRAGGNVPQYEAFALNELCHFHGGFCNSLHCDALAHMCRVPYRLGRIHPEIGVPISEETTQLQAGEGLIGASGCGLCALWRMQEMGITHLKLVSRGNYAEDTLRDIRAMKQALALLEGAPSEQAYIRQMKELVFTGKCSGNCYYFGQI